MKACYLFCIICCCGSRLAAQDHSWIGLAATAFDIPAVSVRDTIAIRLIPGPGMEARDLPLVTEAVDWVRLDEVYDITFYDGFLFSIDRGRLVIDINLDIIKNPGRYEARIALSAPGKDRREFTLSLNLPPAKLEALQPVTIRVTGDRIVEQDSLVLREIGHRDDHRQDGHQLAFADCAVDGEFPNHPHAVSIPSDNHRNQRPFRRC